jgi:hypothetical protein
MGSSLSLEEEEVRERRKKGQERKRKEIGAEDQSEIDQAYLTSLPRLTPLSYGNPFILEMAHEVKDLVGVVRNDLCREKGIDSRRKTML